MNILVVSQYFAPENFRVNELVESLVNRGHNVTVLTGQPNYPHGKFYKGHGWFKPSDQELFAAQVIRSPLIPRGDGGRLNLALNYISFAISASFGALFRLRGPFDAVLVFQPSPATVGIPALVAARRFGCPILVWVLDLWPDSLVATNAISNKHILKLAGHFVRYLYHRSCKILVASRGFKTSVLANGGTPEQICYFPNWIEQDYHTPVAKGDQKPTLASETSDGFKIVFAGNIGDAQDFPSVVNAMHMAAKKMPNTKWVIAGDGRAANWLRTEVHNLGLDSKVQFLGQLPPSEMPELFAQADALFLSLRQSATFAQTVPGKLQSYMAAGKPILAMIDGEAARIINEAKAGLTCASGESVQLVDNIFMLTQMSADKRLKMGARGQAYALREFGRENLLTRLEMWMHEAVQQEKKSEKA